MNLKNILGEIAAAKVAEVGACTAVVGRERMREIAEGCERPVLSMSGSLRKRPVAIIAEHKRCSPSKGMIHGMTDAAAIAVGYRDAGAGAMSVLTDTRFFGGALSDLALARKAVDDLPLLRKDFIVDEYQIHEARAYGADAILLIAAILDAETMKRLNDEAHRLGLETLVEVHDESEIERVPGDADMVGVNSRDLTNFVTSLDTSLNLIGKLPAESLKIAESGIKKPNDIARLKEAGFDAFLIGEAFMSKPRPAFELEWFINSNMKK